MERETKDQKEKQLAMKTYIREYDAERARVHSFGAGAMTLGHREHPLYKHPTNIQVPDQPPSQAAAKRLLPPGKVSIWKGNPTGTRQGSWNIHYPPYPRYSRSWIAAGSEKQALKEVLRHVWSLWLKDHFLPREHCPLQNIWD